eukprot:TRINITY_DN496_c0_g1_i1.p1 TRINITY_DN496_c0_g1~~TRINITY_DN496_c0_g1_i1.p1  ORF type:complete len:317 (+),score=60.71 TRINITY_DN496_c0_g1_i1:212-1162(+)
MNPILSIPLTMQPVGMPMGDVLESQKLVHTQVYQYLLNCNMKNTAACFLEESSELMKYSITQLINIGGNTTETFPAEPLPADPLKEEPQSFQLCLQPSPLVENVVVNEILPASPAFIQSPPAVSSSSPIMSLPIPATSQDAPFEATDEDTEATKEQVGRTRESRILYSCRYPGCKGSFTTLANMKRHEKLHSGEKPYGCDSEGCNKRFARKYDLKLHSRTHTKEKPYVCAMIGCEKRFGRISSLKEHERNIHNLIGDSTDINIKKEESADPFLQSSVEPLSGLSDSTLMGDCGTAETSDWNQILSTQMGQPLDLNL